MSFERMYFLISISERAKNLNLAYQYLTKLQMLFGYLRRYDVFPPRSQHDHHRNQSLLNSPIKKQLTTDRNNLESSIQKKSKVLAVLKINMRFFKTGCFASLACHFKEVLHRFHYFHLTPAEAKALHPAVGCRTRRMSMAFQNSWKLNACDDVFMLEAISPHCKILNDPQDPSPFINVIAHGQQNHCWSSNLLDLIPVFLMFGRENVETWIDFAWRHCLRVPGVRGVLWNPINKIE